MQFTRRDFCKYRGYLCQIIAEAVIKNHLKIVLHYFDKFTHVPRVFRIAYLLQPHQVINSTLAHLFLLTVPILDLRHICPYTFRPVVKLIVLPGFGIRQSEKVMSVSAER